MVALAGIIAMPHARGASFCAHSAAEIQTALTTAATNGEDDVIMIAAGSYALATSLVFSSSEPHAISIQGGFSPLCDSFTRTETTLDGQHQLRPLYVGSVNGNVQVAFLTFAAGLAANGNSGGGLIAASDAGDVDVVLNRFIGNRAMAQAGALYAYSSSGSVRVRNNLLVANRGGEVGGLVVVQPAGEADVVSNTIVANTSDAANAPAGLALSGNAHFTLSNNIVWNNAAAGGSDFGTASSHSRIANDIGIIVVGSAVADVVAGELSIDPALRPAADLSASTSSLRVRHRSSM
jgi:hypothetical protein